MQRERPGAARSPSPPVGDGATLTGVTCVSAGDCIAVGFRGATDLSSNEAHETLIEQNTGAGWTIVPSPNPPAGPDGIQGDSLSSVACVGPSYCWAVGQDAESSTSTVAVVEQDAGDGWSLVSAPSLAGGGGLLGVTCVTATDCWAVGSAIEHDTGGGWTAVSSPTPPSPGGLVGVVCVDSRDCWADGVTLGSGATGETLIERTQ